MGSCRGVPSSVCTSRYISWCVDAAESPTPVNSTQPAPGEFPQNNHGAVGSGAIPLLLLSPPEAGTQPTSPTRTHHRASVRSHPSQLNPCSSSALHIRGTNGHRDRGEGDNRQEGGKLDSGHPETDNRSQEDLSLLHPENERFHLPRSSPVISKHQRPLSWHGGGTDTSSPSGSDSPPPASGSLSQHQHGPMTGSMEDLGFKSSSCQRSSLLQDKKQRCVSVSANLNNFLLSLFHLPFSGQQGLAEGHRGQGPSSCRAPHSPDLSNSGKDRRCSSIPESSAGIFKSSCELEKENAHFIVVDMVLEVLESVKWTLSVDQRTAPGHEPRTRRDTSSAEDDLPHEDTQGCDADKPRYSGEDVKASHSNTRSSAGVRTRQRTQDTGEEEETGKEDQPKSFSVLSTDSGFEDYGGDTMATQKDSLRNAELLAQQLVFEFRRSWLPSRGPRRGRQSLRSSLQELPGTGSMAVSGGSLAEEIRLRTRMRGSLNWAPPRFQIIFTVHPTHRRSHMVALQHFLCAGCGTKVEPRYIKKLLYCEYLGRYFCDCCHSGSEAVIPARVLSSWDFGRYPVSDFSKQLLDSVWYQPLFDLTSVGKTLYSRVKELDKLRELQEQLLCTKKLLKACRLSERVMMEFEQLPAHLMEQPHLFSMDDLLRVKKGQLVAQARAVLNTVIVHIENCKLCQARGFICEFCRDRDIIFPFQTDICKRCPVCKTCFHKRCFAGKKCPKCARIQSRKKCPDGSAKCDN